MHKLFLDSSGSILTIILTKENQVLESYSKSAFQKQTEFTLKTIDDILTKYSITLAQIDEVMITNGPGSYTGVRVAITFVKTLSVLNPNLKIFVVNSLLLQAGLQKMISIFSGYNNKSFLAVFDQGKEIIPTQLVSESAKEGIIRDLKGFEPVVDFKDVDIVANFISLQEKATRIEKIEDLQPIYVGDNFVK